MLYGDTDSIFIKKPSEQQIHTIVEQAKADHGVDLEIDKVYRYCVLSNRKKNYLGVTKDGKVDVNLLCNQGKFEIRILDEDGNYVHEETHDAKGPYNRTYNLNELPNGSYRFIVEMNDEMHEEESFGKSVIIAVIL